LIDSPLVARLDLVSLLARTMLVLDHSDKLEMVLALTDLFLVELITASLERLLVEPKFSFELVVAKEDDRLSWKEDRWLADVLLRLTLLFLMFSRELETDFGGSMLSRLPKPGSDNWLLKLGGAELGQYPPKLDIVLARALRRLLVATFSRSPRDTFSREPKTFALMFSVELDRKLSL